MSVDVELGEIDFMSKTPSLRLTSKILASFATSVEDDIDELRRRLTACQLNEDSVHRPWISRGTTFKLILSLRDDIRLSADDRRLLIEELSRRLQLAKLWQQLHFLPPSVRTFADETTHADVFEIYLTKSNEPEDKSKRKLHKLGIDVPSCDAKPPPGVCRASLEIVHLNLLIRKPSCRKRRRLQFDGTNAHKANKISEGTADNATVYKDNAVVELFADELLQPLAPCLNDLTDASEWPSASDERDDDDETDMLLGAEYDHTSDASQPIVKIPTLLKRNSSASNIEVDESQTLNHTVLQLVDAALRRAISGSPTRLAKGILLHQNGSFRSLANIAPSMWSPGYLPAVASRAVFLPTISHALASVCTNNPSPERSEFSMDALNECYSNQRTENSSGVSDGSNGSKRCHSLFNHLCAKLWQTTQDTLYDWEAARRLKPLSEPTSGSTEGITPDDELLEPSQEHDEDTMSQQSEYDDFLLGFETDLEDHEYDDFDLFESIYEIPANTNTNYVREWTDKNNMDKTKYSREGEVHRSRNTCLHGKSLEFWNHPSMPDLRSDHGGENRAEDDTMSICDSFATLSMIEEREADFEDLLIVDHDHVTQEVLCT